METSDAAMETIARERQCMDKYSLKELSLL